jgi:hypothetical protein
MHRRLVVGALLALLFAVFSFPSPVQALPAWKEAIADIEEIRDGALADIYDRGAEFTEFLDSGPDAQDATEKYYETLEDLQAVGRSAVEQIGVIMSEFPNRQAVQDEGILAKEQITGAQAFSESYATFEFNEYLEQLEEPPSSPTTTTTTVAPPATTTTTVPPATTTTAPPTVTTTTEPPTTVPPARPPTTTTSETRTTTTTTTIAVGDAVPPGGGDQTDGGSSQRDQIPLSLGGGDESFLAAGPGGESASSTSRLLEPTLSLSLSRVLDPLLPAQVTEVVVSPLFMLELLWRAISSSGQGLVAPISLLLFSLLSLLRDRRQANERTAESPG